MVEGKCLRGMKKSNRRSFGRGGDLRMTKWGKRFFAPLGMTEGRSGSFAPLSAGRETRATAG